MRNPKLTLTLMVVLVLIFAYFSKSDENENIVSIEVANAVAATENIENDSSKTYPDPDTSMIGVFEQLRSRWDIKVSSVPILPEDQIKIDTVTLKEGI